ncbi:MAG: hypothetical protein WAS73_12240 [Defluviicoccus sp.]
MPSHDIPAPINHPGSVPWNIPAGAAQVLVYNPPPPIGTNPANLPNTTFEVKTATTPNAALQHTQTFTLDNTNSQLHPVVIPMTPIPAKGTPWQVINTGTRTIRVEW